MKKIIFLMFALLFVSLNSVQVYFLHGTTDLTEESITHIAKFKGEFEIFFQENPNTTIFITGHTDNTGTRQFNKKLSINRGNLIKDYLINELNVNAEYIQVYGRGSDEPIATNDTDDGRYLNRRVDIVFEKSEAQIKWLQNIVEYIPSKSGEIVSAKQNDDLFRFDKINTENRSRSGIEFNDKNLLILEENSLMVIFGEITSSFSQLLDDKFHVELKYGKLYNKLENMNNKPLNVRTPAADLELYSSLNNVEFSDNQTLTSVYEGYGLVLAQGESIKVNEGYGIKVETGKEPEAPVKLPDIPVNISVTDRDPLLNGEKIYLSWVGQAHEYLIEIASDKNFMNIIRHERSQINNTDLDFEYGTYYLRSRAVDDIGLQSDYSNNKRIDVLEKEFITVKDLKEGKINGSPNDVLILEGSTIDKIKVLINNKDADLSKTNSFSRKLDLVYGMNTLDLSAVLPNNTKKNYHYKISYKPDINRNIIFRDLYEDASAITNLEDFLIVADAPGMPELYLNGSKMFLDNSGHMEHAIKLIQGENKLTFRAEFIDGSEREFNFVIIYEKEPESFLIYNIIGYASTFLITISPLIINAAN